MTTARHASSLIPLSAGDKCSPAKILEVGFGFWGSKVLLTAVELGLFTQLSGHSMSADEIGHALDLHPRGRYDFLDCLLSMGFLQRQGKGPSARYSNTIETARFLDRSQPEYMGGMLEMLNARLFNYWNDLGAALKTGQPQNEVRHSQAPLFDTLYSNAARLELRVVASAPKNLPDLSDFDGKHAQWRTDVILKAKALCLPFTHGTAAKLINVYLKTMFVCGGHDDHERVSGLHPPIDAVLLKELGEKQIGGPERASHWKKVHKIRWSKLDSHQYEDVIRHVRLAMGSDVNLWRIEEYWQGYQSN